MLEIYIWNQSTLTADDEVQTAVAAIQRQVANDFAPQWGVGAVLHFVPKGVTPMASAIVIKLVDSVDVDGALGYHEDGSLIPSGIVGVKTCMDDGVTWSSCLSHEVLELVADPDCVRCYQVDSAVVALEVCDACEGFAYTIDGVEVSDFVLPTYFTRGPGPWSFTGNLDGPWPALGPGGYYSAAPMGEWSQQNAEHVRPSKRSVGIGSRREKRHVQ